MKKKLLASLAGMMLLASFVFQPVRNVAAAVVYSGMAIINSTIDSTVIGGTTPAAGHFTTLNSSSTATLGAIISGSIAGSFTSMNSFPSVAGSSSGWTGYGHNGTGDMDFIATNNGSSPSFYWYFLLGSSTSVEMFLDQSANLHVPNGSVSANSFTAAASVSLPHYTVATIPSASTLGAGGTVVVSDCTTMALASTICTGGGSNYMLAISNGTNWTMH